MLAGLNPVRMAAVGLVVLGTALMARDCWFQCKDVQNVWMRDFARWFWTGMGRDCGLVCIETDLGEKFPAAHLICATNGSIRRGTRVASHRAWNTSRSPVRWYASNTGGDCIPTTRRPSAIGYRRCSRTTISSAASSILSGTTPTATSAANCPTESRSTASCRSGGTSKPELCWAFGRSLIKAL